MNSNRGAATPSSPSPNEGAAASSMPTITTGKILSLALPSLGALIAEPLFTVIDSTMVGHWAPLSSRAWASRQPS